MYQIGDSILEISCFRSIPGQEVDLARKMEKDGGVPFKGLGAFDIISFSPAEGIFTDRYAGLPQMTVNTAVIPSFSLTADERLPLAEILSDLRLHSCAALAFIKLKSVPDKNYGDWKKSLIRKMLLPRRSTRQIGRYVLGTLGWYELVVITCADDLGTVVREALRLGLDCHDAVAKTYSVVCIGRKELDLLSGQEDKLRSPRPFEEIIPKEINATLAISIGPSSTRALQAFWSAKRYEVSDVLGREDVLVTPPDAITWGQLLEDLLRFRKQHSREILYTQLRVAQITTPVTDDGGDKQGIGKTVRGEGDSEKDAPEVSLEVSPSAWSDTEVRRKLKDYLGPSSAARLIAMVEHVLSLRRNQVEGIAFEDMSRYVESIPQKFSPKSTRADGDTSEPLPSRGDSAANLIKEGIELRLHGIHGTMGELSLQLPPLRSGVHRVLLAIDAFTYCVRSSRLDAIWQGFANSSSRRFFSSVEIINVPYSCLYSPTDWWGIYHEIGHIFILDNEDKAFLTKETDAVKSFLTKTKGEHNWFDLIEEIAAEIIGFELGFYGDFDLFARRLWEYLKLVLQEDRTYEHDPASFSEHRVKQYFIRSFCVKLYNDHVLGDAALDVFEDADLMYEKFYEHIQWVYGNVLGQKTPRSMMCFLAARYAKPLMLLKDVLVHIRGYLHGDGENGWPLPEKSETKKDRGQEKTNTGHVVEAILEGKVWTRKVNYPEAILYWLMQEEYQAGGHVRKKLSVQQEVAAILTFWNLYRRELSQTRFDKGDAEVKP
jgi:hypothetical protein